MERKTGIFTNIQRFSLHDGPGIRTTIFLKGCPLRCIWCHNPETWKRSSELFVHDARCTGCGICVKECKSEAISIRDGKGITDRSLCHACFDCASVCPNRARSICGEEYDVDELVSLLLRDRKYYEKSNGGVTFSGGEPLLQTDFVCETADRLRTEGIHTAIETSAYADSETIEKVIDHINFFMVDLKSTNDAKHRNFTGVSVKPILENIERLSDRGTDVLIRIPIVETFNADLENINATSEFLLKHTKFRRVELLRMHKLAEGKYSSLDRPYAVRDLPEPSENKMQELAHALADRGMTVYYKKDIYNTQRQEGLL